MARSIIKDYLRSFTGRMVLGTLLVHVLLLPLVALGIFQIISHEVEQQFVNYSRAQSAQYARLLEQETNKAHLDFMLKDMQLSGQVSFADFLTEHGELLPKTPETQAESSKFAEDFMFGQHNDSIYYIALPVQGPDGNISGTLRLGFDEEPVKEYVSRIGQRGLYMALGYLALSILLVGVVGNRLALSIRQLRDASRRVAGGDTAESLVVTTHISDVSSLADDLEYMRSQLVKREEDLQAAIEINTQTLASLANAQRIAQLGNWDWNLKSRELKCSEQIYRIFGLNPQQKTPDTINFLKLAHKDDQKAVRAWLFKLLKTGEPREFEHRITLPGGGERIIGHHAEVSRGKDGRSLEIHGIVQDVTLRRLAEERIRHLAYYDSLTGLPNRQMFSDQLTRALTHGKRHHEMFAVMFLDLDGFKQINDTLGHNYGDMLLQQVSQRLAACVRSSDYVSRIGTDGDNEQEDSSRAKGEVARLGGDEFTMILSELAHPEDAAMVAQRILDTINEPYKLDSHEVFVSTSIGIAIFPNDGEDTETLVMNADTSMYHAKSKGRSCYQFYHKSMNADALEKLKLQNHLHRALEREEFILHYQPKFDVVSGKVTGVEALIRWDRPDIGIVGPLGFIPQAEENSLIMPISQWVLEKACRQNKAWHQAGFSDLIVAVNISGSHFKHNSLAPAVAKALQDSGLDPRYLELEVTEGTLMQEVEDTLATLTELKTMGVRISIDDFGTGYSSLSYLKRFPLDTVKIDRSFVQDITTDKDDAAITMAIIALATTLKLEVVGEGVETSEQVDFLRQNGCRIMQGFFFSRPVTPEAMTKLLLAVNSDATGADSNAGKVRYLKLLQ